MLKIATSRGIFQSLSPPLVRIQTGGRSLDHRSPNFTHQSQDAQKNFEQESFHNRFLEGSSRSMKLQKLALVNVLNLNSSLRQKSYNLQRITLENARNSIAFLDFRMNSARSSSISVVLCLILGREDEKHRFCLKQQAQESVRQYHSYRSLIIENENRNISLQKFFESRRLISK